MQLVWKIALGIILASLIMSLGGLIAAGGLAWWADEQLEQGLSEQHKRQQERERVAAVAKLKEAEIQRIAALREQEARDAEVVRLQARTRLTNQFAEQYVPPEDCANPVSEKRFVECVDHRRRAKSEYFEQNAL